MNITSWILFGIIIGIVGNSFNPVVHRGGLLGSILLGIGGAILGGLLAQIFFGISITGFNLISFVIAVAGSLTVLIAGRLMERTS